MKTPQYLRPMVFTASCNHMFICLMDASPPFKLLEDKDEAVLGHHSPLAPRTLPAIIVLC